MRNQCYMRNQTARHSCPSLPSLRLAIQAPSFPGVDADAFVHRRRAAGVKAAKHWMYLLRRLAAFVEAHFFEGQDAAPMRCGGSADRRRSAQ